MQKAIDDKSRLGVFDDVNKLLKMKAAMALETAAQSQGETGASLGMGMGFMMPGMIAEALKGGSAPAAPPDTTLCPACRRPAGSDAKFCPHCGRQLPAAPSCAGCGENLPRDAKYCVRCGRPVGQKPQEKECSHCGTENQPDSAFCSRCGQRI